MNRRAVFAACETGLGHSGLEMLCSVMDMPCISSTGYLKQKKTMKKRLEEQAKEEMKEAGIRLRNLLKQDDSSVTEDSVVDVAVSFDGTWAKRGFTSMTGVVFVVSVDTGEVLDSKVITKTCEYCKQWECRRESEPEKFHEWKAEHIRTGKCQINFEGSSSAMEANGAEILFSRSVARHNMRYRWMISDGDSKAYTRVVEKDVYGEDCKVEKVDCVGHVQKRMGKHLRNLRQSHKGKLKDGKAVGGRGARLNDPQINKLQRYYGLAIRQNTVKTSCPSEAEVDASVKNMKMAITATLHHCVKHKSLCEQHKFCPKGKSSWCQWQVDKATGTKAYNNKGCLDEVFLVFLKPKFEFLSQEQLLRRCVFGATQNNNESLNSLVWVRCPKHKYHGPTTVRIAVALAVLAFNNGHMSKVQVLEKLDISAHQNAEKVWRKRDQKRIKRADKAITDKEKKRRQNATARKLKQLQAISEQEGVQYQAGGFGEENLEPITKKGRREQK